MKKEEKPLLSKDEREEFASIENVIDFESQMFDRLHSEQTDVGNFRYSSQNYKRGILDGLERAIQLTRYLESNTSLKQAYCSGLQEGALRVSKNIRDHVSFEKWVQGKPIFPENK
jgi:hypothetical protein